MAKSDNFTATEETEQWVNTAPPCSTILLDISDLLHNFNSALCWMILVCLKWHSWDQCSSNITSCWPLSITCREAESFIHNHGHRCLWYSQKTQKYFMNLQQSVMHKLQFIPGALKSQKKLLTRSLPFLFAPERLFQEKQSLISVVKKTKCSGTKLLSHPPKKTFKILEINKN